MFLFYIFGAIAVVAAAGVILSRRPIYSALFLLVNFASLAALYIMLEAQFLAAVQVIVYAGAIVVLFLFVVMLIGGGELRGVRDRDKPWRAQFTWPKTVALALGLLLLAGVVYGLISGQLNPNPIQTSNIAFDHGSVQAIGNALYTEYLLPFELTSVLLLVGMIGAVVLARNEE